MIIVHVRFDNGATVACELAITPLERAHGLSGRRSLPPGRGMLFDMQRIDQGAFHMDGVVLPLDILFLTHDGQVAEIYRGTPLDQHILRSQTYHIRYMLEVNAGWAADHGVAPGARIV